MSMTQFWSQSSLGKPYWCSKFVLLSLKIMPFRWTVFCFWRAMRNPSLITSKNMVQNFITIFFVPMEECQCSFHSIYIVFVLRLKSKEPTFHKSPLTISGKGELETVLWNVCLLKFFPQLLIWVRPSQLKVGPSVFHLGNTLVRH